MPTTVRRWAVCLLLLLGLAACHAPPSRYSQEHDSAPARQLDPQAIEDAVPRPEVIRQAGNYSPYEVLGRRYTVMSQDQARTYRERGEASWYGSKFHGHLTSNGEVYDMYGMSAAHKSLPIPCYVRVTNLDNGRSAIVRVNDRGPFHPGRIIDLSYAAATKLGYAQGGVARVEVERIDTAALPPAPAPHAATTAAATLVPAADAPVVAGRYLQAAAFSELAMAESYRRRLEALLAWPVSIDSRAVGRRMWHRVRIGPIEEGAGADQVRELLSQQQLGSPHWVGE